MIEETVMVNSVEYDARHGGPFDRGSADSYYHRPRRPHYFVGATNQSPEVIPGSYTEEYDAYIAGYNWNEKNGDKKEW